jgi:hypothetical protein
MRAHEEHNQINTQLMQSLNQLQIHVKNGLGSRHEEEGKHHARRDNYIISRHSRSTSRTHRHQYSPNHSYMIFYPSEDSRSNPKVSHVRHQRSIYMSWTACEESLGRLSHHPLMVKTKGEMMLRFGFLE